MATKLLKWSWLAVAALALAVTSQAQITSYEEQRPAQHRQPCWERGGTCQARSGGLSPLLCGLPWRSG